MLTSLSYQRVLPYPAEVIWPVLSDTASVNRRLKLAPMKFTTVNGVRHGTQKMMGINLHWTEKPWEWHWNHWLKNERVFSNGFFYSIQGLFSLTPAEGGTRVELVFKLDHRYGLFVPLITKATNSLLIKLMDEIEALVQVKSQAQIIKRADTVDNWLQVTHQSERSRISPKELAFDIQQPWKGVLREVLANFDKRLALRFDAVCPHCRGAKDSVPRLTELPKKIVCESCQIEFDVDSQESIDISLRDSSIPDAMVGIDFCSADVIHKPTIILQRLGGSWQEKLTLSPGLYRLKRKGESKTHTFVVQPEGKKIHLRLTKEWPAELLEQWQPDCIIEAVDLPDDTFIMLERLDKERGALTVSELLTDSDIVSLRPPPNLITSFPLEMGQKAVLFTDVVGSTEMYFRIGDQAAFKLVRESFLVIGEQVKQYHGVLVKTIGDATMYAFPSVEEALRAAIDIQLAHRTQELKLRASLHYGPCISVNTADGQDYFGDTINICAKFQSKAEADEIGFDRAFRMMVSEEFWRELSQQHQIEDIEFSFKSRHFELTRVKI